MAHILVVDDESNIRMMLKLALQHVGHTVETAADGYEGLERFGPEGTGWDLILLDQRMPGIEGLEVLREMRTRRPDTRVILITAFGTFDLAEEAIRAGASDFLRKPFTIEILRGAVDAALQNSSTPVVRTTLPTPQWYDRAGINGYRIASEPGVARRNNGSIEDTFTVAGPDGASRTVRVSLPPYTVELIKAHADREELPGGDSFYQALCGEALANYLWQHSETPGGDSLQVEDLTSGLRHWIDAVLVAGTHNGRAGNG